MECAFPSPASATMWKQYMNSLARQLGVWTPSSRAGLLTRDAILGTSTIPSHWATEPVLERGRRNICQSTVS
jgi:hypothetical protein